MSIVTLDEILHEKVSHLYGESLNVIIRMAVKNLAETHDVEVPTVSMVPSSSDEASEKVTPHVTFPTSSTPDTQVKREAFATALVDKFNLMFHESITEAVIT